MKITRLLALATSVLLVAAMTGCSKAPTDKLEAANAAVQAARDAGAGDYARDAMAQADQALAAMNEEKKSQDGKFALFRSYGKASELAVAAEAAAQTAKTEAAAGKERAKTEAMAAMTQARAALDTAKTMMASAPMGKGSAADIEAMKQDLMAIETSLAEVDSSLAAEDYLGAKAKAEMAMQNAQNVQNSLTTAIEMKKAAGHH